LGVAGIALFTSQLALAEARLAQVAPAWALGLTRRRLATLELGKTLALAAEMQGRGRLLAWDANPRRMTDLPERARRAGVAVKLLGEA
ncbi:hypothetical protein RCK87_26005, partial [Salmonella enterica subsp. enterica serovar 1,4,[5],12:i:-]